ncbi:MAG TPA: SRPBCC family protein [Mycobacteriales bacterium]|nr:SRPBCC family protein [Mycobacteriales bacterium]
MNDTFEPGPLSPVESEPAGERWTLAFVRDLRQPPERVWTALTDPAELAQWAPYTADRDLGSVGPVTLSMIDGLSHADLPATVRRVERPAVLEYTWGPTDILRWELAATGSGTRLTLRHTVENRAMLPKVAAGWHLCLRVAEELLDGTPIPPIRGDEARKFGWDELFEAYADALGIPPNER